MANQTAWQAWHICHEMGRDGYAGIMQANQVIAVLEALDGTTEDLRKVQTIERLYRELNPREKKD
jgi:hypothetical protein